MLLALQLLCVSCGLLERRQDHTLLARAYGNRLYLEDIADIIPPGSQPTDSAAIVQQYVERWVEQQVFLYHAKQYLQGTDAALERKVESYRNALLVNAYENHLAREEMDTLVSEADITEFYDRYKPHFILKENIIRGTYVKLPLGVRNHDVVRSLYRSELEEDLEQLEDFALQHAATYYIGMDRWISFDDILIDMPLDPEDQARYLRNNRFAEITDDYYRYFLYVSEYRLQGDESPVAFEYDNIRRLILSRRKMVYLQEKRRELFMQAIEAKRIETHY